MISTPEPRRPIKLLVNGLHSKSGGGITYLTNILPQLAADPAVEVHLCVNEDQRELMSAALNSISVHLLSFRTSFWQRLLREQVELPALARRLGIDVTFSPANYGPMGVPNSVILLRNALSVAFVERRPIKLMYWFLVYLGTAVSLMICRRAIAVSNYARRSAGGGLLSPIAGRIAVIPHGVSEIFTPPAEGAERGGFLLAVSDIYVQKNLKNLLLALDKLRARHPDIRLKIAGRPIDEDYYASLRRLVDRLDLGRHVEFLGAVPQAKLAELYRTCALFVFPSSVETFGNPLVEAMACGAPIASSNTAAMPEVVGEAALFFAPDDIDEMAAVLDRMLNDRAICRELSAKAARRAHEFSWARTAQRTLGVIKEAFAPA